MTTTTHNPLYAATADRLTLMFARAEAHADERDDITRGIGALFYRGAKGAAYLHAVLDRLETAEVTTLTHEERVSLYVASKAVGR
jgi:hypothetical protein